MSFCVGVLYRKDALPWACIVVYDIGFVAVIVRSDTSTGKRGRTSFVLIGCERSVKYILIFFNVKKGGH